MALRKSLVKDAASSSGIAIHHLVPTAEEWDHVRFRRILRILRLGQSCGVHLLVRPFHCPLQRSDETAQVVVRQGIAPRCARIEKDRVVLLHLLGNARLIESFPSRAHQHEAECLMLFFQHQTVGSVFATTASARAVALASSSALSAVRAAGSPAAIASSSFCFSPTMSVTALASIVFTFSTSALRSSSAAISDTSNRITRFIAVM